MPVEYRCPGCDSSVLVPEEALAVLDSDTPSIGCNNTEDHADNVRLVMWRED